MQRQHHFYRQYDSSRHCCIVGRYYAFVDIMARFNAARFGSGRIWTVLLVRGEGGTISFGTHHPCFCHAQD